jgi:hypothetical protein
MLVYYYYAESSEEASHGRSLRCGPHSYQRVYDTAGKRGVEFGCILHYVDSAGESPEVTGSPVTVSHIMECNVSENLEQAGPGLAPP